jgi:hypothetical protein
VNEFQFEIFLRGFDRYSWRLVQRGGDRRVLAKAPVDFPTPQLAENSIMVMKEIVAHAEIVRVDAGYGEPVGFEIVDAFPLRLKNTVSTRDAPAAADRSAAALRPSPGAERTGAETSGSEEAGAEKISAGKATAEPAKAIPAARKPAAKAASEGGSDGGTPRKTVAAKARRS